MSIDNVPLILMCFTWNSSTFTVEPGCWKWLSQSNMSNDESLEPGDSGVEVKVNHIYNSTSKTMGNSIFHQTWNVFPCAFCCFVCCLYAFCFLFFPIVLFSFVFSLFCSFLCFFVFAWGVIVSDQIIFRSMRGPTMSCSSMHGLHRWPGACATIELPDVVGANVRPCSKEV